jgi:hypothetical protein
LRIAEEKMKQRILAFHQEADEKINQVLADHAKLVEHAAKIDAAHARLVSIEVYMIVCIILQCLIRFCWLDGIK